MEVQGNRKSFSFVCPCISACCSADPTIDFLAADSGQRRMATRSAILGGSSEISGLMTKGDYGRC